MMCYAGDTSCASDANIIHATSRKQYENQRAYKNERNTNWDAELCCACSKPKNVQAESELWATTARARGMGAEINSFGGWSC